MINVTGDYSVKKEKDYPYIGIDNHKTIVLFGKEDWGMVIDTGTAKVEAGEYCEWFEENFTPIQGTITISNK